MTRIPPLLKGSNVSLPSFLKYLLRTFFRKLGFEIEYVGRPRRSSRAVVASPGSASAPYVENPEIGPGNLAEKLAQVQKGQPFEWPNIVALNRAVAAMVPSALRIVELGGGTGCFALEAAAVDDRYILSSELDTDTSRWAARNRPAPNIRYIDRMPVPEDGPFDLVVAIEIIEHVEDFTGLLRLCARLSSRAIITTPNRCRGPKFDVPGPPPLAKHVREWTAGEFYWTLRCFYRDVRLFAMPNPYQPEVIPIRVTDTLSPLIADCRDPYLDLVRDENQS